MATRRAHVTLRTVQKPESISRGCCSVGSAVAHLRRDPLLKQIVRTLNLNVDKVTAGAAELSRLRNPFAHNRLADRAYRPGSTTHAWFQERTEGSHPLANSNIRARSTWRWLTFRCT